MRRSSYRLQLSNLALGPGTLETGGPSPGDSRSQSAGSRCPSRAGLDLRHVLAPLDGSALAECVLPFAERMVAATGARLTLLTVVDAARPDGETVDAFDWEMRWSSARAYLNRIAAELAERGTAASVELAKGRAAAQVLAFIRDHAVDLVVLSTHGEGGLTNWSLSSTADKVLSRSPASVMVIPAHAERTSSEDPARVRRLLVPLDMSPRAECVLPLAVRLARHHGAEIVLAHVVQEPELPRHAPASQEDKSLAAQLVERNREEAGRYLENVRLRLVALRARVRTRLTLGPRCSQLLRDVADEEDADLLLVCAHGHDADAERTHGHVPARLAHESTRPVLIVQDLPTAAAAMVVAAAEEQPGH